MDTKEYEWRVVVDFVGTIGTVRTIGNVESSARQAALSMYGEEGNRMHLSDNKIFEDDEFLVVPV